MPEITVRAMTDAEFTAWQHALARAYADEQVRSGNWAPGEALRRAREGNAALLPQGLGTPGMLLLTATRPDGEPVGRIWLSLEHPRGTADCAFLYDIEVEEPHRGQGYGRALLTAAEEAARSRGRSALELNVFGDNATAIALYESAGFVVVQQQMRTALTRDRTTARPPPSSGPPTGARSAVNSSRSPKRGTRGPYRHPHGRRRGQRPPAIHHREAAVLLHAR
ncbi:GNAT family N-acetyltransferase [Blastococcus haudaquaticus]|uniref:GNAT family N-acetyltransferase n=1 Tax=Blastococcus haudaquaticus TaxID=1938745 RepID=UPI000BE34ECC|nr:GNAT family N-acetyltransferase [Blastococcus haudaquaticus]